RGVQVVRRARGLQRVLTVGMLRVIEHLHLGRVPIDLVLLFTRAIKDAAVPARLDLPVDRELEVAELVVGDDVATCPDAGKSAVLHFPAVGNRRLAVVAPAGGALSIE